MPLVLKASLSLLSLNVLLFDFRFSIPAVDNHSSEGRLEAVFEDFASAVDPT